MKDFFERLDEVARARNSLLCVGLDPHPYLLEVDSAESALQFCLRIIKETAAYAVAFKPNSAFFERYGAAGMAALAEVIAAVPEGIPVILDAKRGDIGSTAAAYAAAVFEGLGADCVTVNPYLGGDGVVPFVQDAERGVFVLCKTSNEGSAELQDQIIDTVGTTLYQHVAHVAGNWSEYDNIGLVVGATWPQHLREVRAIAPDSWLLAPGVGAQGGDLGAALAAGLRADGLGVLISVSRGILAADDAGETARTFRDAINDARMPQSANNLAPRPMKESVADALLAAGCVRFGDFTLKSGLQSPIYIDMRRLASYPLQMAVISDALQQRLQAIDFDHIAALPYAALPIGAVTAHLGGWSLVYPRREAKQYGTKAAVEGVFEAGQTVVLLDDLITTGGSKFEAVAKMEAVDLKVRDVLVVVDREQGAAERLAAQGLHLHAIAKISDLLQYWHGCGVITEAEFERTRAFLAAG